MLNYAKFSTYTIFFFTVFVASGCISGQRDPGEKSRQTSSSMKAEQPEIAPVIEANYSQCRYHGDSPRVDVVREIDLATVLTPAFGQPLPDAPILGAGRIGIWFFLGQRPTPGYGIVLDSVLTNIEQGHLTVGINETKPDPRRRITQISTSPCVLISINDISFIKLTVAGDVTGLPIGLALE